MALNKCPKCGCMTMERDIVSVKFYYDGTTTLDTIKDYGRIGLICRNDVCEQRFWYYSSGKITRRNK